MLIAKIVRGAWSRELAAALLMCGALATAHGAEDRNALAKAVMQASFVADGQAGLDRLDQDETQAACSRYAPADPPAATVARIVKLNQATVVPPDDGKYLGDYRKGEVIAETGTGLQSNDDPSKPAGGNCYACHELAKSQIAYGTVGPSLHKYGALRGQTLEMLNYTWTKLYNTKALMPCSNMPRFGARHILTKAQLSDVMAYLFDPESPVNK